jgi:hypothetical protein
MAVLLAVLENPDCADRAGHRAVVALADGVTSEAAWEKNSRLLVGWPLPALRRWVQPGTRWRDLRFGLRWGNRRLDPDEKISPQYADSIGCGRSTIRCSSDVRFGGPQV